MIVYAHRVCSAPKPPLCKGRWAAKGGSEGLPQRDVSISHWVSANSHSVLHNPSVKNQRFLTAPFTQGSLLGAPAPVQSTKINDHLTIQACGLILLHAALLILLTAAAGTGIVSANLALALARHGCKVAYVDMDLRKPAVHKIFSQLPREDLKTCLKEGAPASWDTPKRLHILSCNQPTPAPDKLLHSEELVKLLFW